jgi:hypothetical protein
MPQHPPAPTEAPGHGLGTISRRLLGAALLGAAYLPLHRLLDPDVTGLAGASTRRIAEASWTLGVWGSVAVVGVALVLAMVVRVDPGEAVRSLANALARPRLLPFALGCGALTLLLAAGVARGLYGGHPTSVDEMVQLLHARALVGGHAVLPLPAGAAAWVVQNSLVVDGGWVSIYPPFHTALLAAGLALGAPWLVGPVMTALLAFANALALDRLLPDRPALARGAALLVALSPFLLFLGGTELSHPTAGALAAVTLLCALLARDGSWTWSLATGAAVGAFVCTRPWTGVALSAALVATTWFPAALARPSALRWSAARLVGLALGGIPFAALLFGWNDRLFGDPFRLGYLSAYGPAHGLGWHPDPWGNLYGARQALAYTGADLVQLGARLLETPLPALAMVGLGLAVLPALPSGAAPLLAWACAGVIANAAYWHHGIHFGPRLLFEAAPAWVALWAVAWAGLSGPRSPLPTRLRGVVGWVGALSLLGGALLVPGTAGAYRIGEAEAGASRLPHPPEEPVLVFVHGSWSSRVVARLVATGMRRDSVETALRRNALCAVDRYARLRAEGASDLPVLDLDPRPGAPPGLSEVTLSPGNRIRVDGGRALEPGCAREAAADRFGTTELEPLLWQAPPLAGAPLVVARDMGPEANRAAREAFRGYSAWMAIRTPEGASVAPYEEAVSRVWRADAPEGGGGP